MDFLLNAGKFLANNQQTVSAIGSAAQGLDNGNGVMNTLGSVAKGAAAGSVVPGIGTAIGAVGGLISGIWKGVRQKKMMQQQEKEQRDQRRDAMSQMAQSNAAQILSNYPTNGITGSNYYALGGMVNQQYEAEKGEVVQGFPQIQSQELASDVRMIEGRKHEQGGTMGTGGERIYSDRLFLSADAAKKFLI